MRNLNPEILSYLVQKSGKALQTIKNNISKLKRNYPSCTQNAVAQIYAIKFGYSVLSKLDDEDKASSPNLEIQKPVTIKQKPHKRKRNVTAIVEYESDNYFIRGHVKEINKSFNSGCFTCVFVLFRKLIENLLIDILRARFPESSCSSNRELYYSKDLNRHHDFSVILDNLYKQRNVFSHEEKKIIERIRQLCIPFKKDANDKAHSLFHLVESKSEIKNLNITQIMELVKKLHETVLK